MMARIEGGGSAAHPRSSDGACQRRPIDDAQSEQLGSNGRVDRHGNALADAFPQASRWRLRHPRSSGGLAATRALASASSRGPEAGGWACVQGEEPRLQAAAAASRR